MKTTISPYQQQGLDFIAKHGMTFTVEHLGHDCPPFCKDARLLNDMDKVKVFPRKTHIHGHHYRATIAKEGRKPFVLDYWNSYADEDRITFALAAATGRAWPKITAWPTNTKGRGAPRYSLMTC